MNKQELIEVLEMILSSLKESKDRKIEDRENLDLGGSGGIPDDWTPSIEAVNFARERRVSVSESASKYRIWVQTSGKRFSDYDARFLTWLLYERQPPEGESNADYESMIGYEPIEAEFDWAATFFAKNNSIWGKALGPEPGMLGCKCPPEILRKHGINPETGTPLRNA